MSAPPSQKTRPDQRGNNPQREGPRHAAAWGAARLDARPAPLVRGQKETPHPGACVQRWCSAVSCGTWVAADGLLERRLLVHDHSSAQAAEPFTV